MQTFPQLLAAIVPIPLALLVARHFLRRRKPMLGIFAGLSIALGLWLVAEPWAYPSSCGANQACNFNDYLRQVWYRYAPFTQFVLPILIALLPAQFFLRYHRVSWSILSGLGVVALFVLVMEYNLFESCRTCGSALCCEWTGIGVVFYLGLGSIEAIVVTLVTLGLARNNRQT